MIYWTAFTLGLLGSVHCMTMCAPLMLALPLSARQRWGMAIDGLQYNMGRVVSYSFIGLLFGILGKGIFIANLQQEFSIALGITLLLLALFKINLEYQLLRIPLFTAYSSFIKRKLNHLLRHSHSHFLLGMLNGFLPCGLVYLALAGAVTTGSPWSGTAFMAFFGLGTFPMMLSVFFVGKKLHLPSLAVLAKFNNVVLVVLAIFLIYRGLNSHLPSNLRFWEMLQHPVMCY